MSSYIRKLTACVAAFAAISLALVGSGQAKAQAATTPTVTPASTASTPTTAGTLSSVTYETASAVVTPAANGQTATVTYTVTSSASPSTGPIPVSAFVFTTGEATPRTFQVPSATIAAQNNVINTPTLIQAAVAATSSQAGLGLPPAAGLPACAQIVSGVLVVQLPKLDGGQTAIIPIANFSVIQPISGQAANSSSTSSTH